MNFDKTDDFNEEELSPFPNETEENESSEADAPVDMPFEPGNGDDAVNVGDINYESENEFQDEDDAEEETEPPTPFIDIAPFNPQEVDNFAYTEASSAYYEEKNYELAIEKFGAALESERTLMTAGKTGTSDIIAKSLYWQAEAYVKTQDIPKALGILEDLIQICKGHYLTVAAQRRVDHLKAKHF